MRLTHLSLHDFLPYEDLTLDLSDIRQLAIVGPNGAGKSSLLDGVLWSLYGKGRSSADKMIRTGALVSRACTTWEVRGQTVHICRHRSRTSKAGESGVSLTVNGEVVTRHTIGETDEAIVRLIGIPMKALLAGPFMVQNRSAELMEETPGGRIDLLSKIFGLDEYGALHDIAKERARLAESEVKFVAGEIGRLGAVLYGEAVGDAIDFRPREEVVYEELESASAEVTEMEAHLEESVRLVTELSAEASALAERAKLLEGLADQIDAANRRLDQAAVAHGILDSEEKQYRLVPTAEEPVLIDPTAIEADLEVARQGAETLAKGNTEIVRLRTEYLNAHRQVGILTTVPCGGEGLYAGCRFLTDAKAAESTMQDLISVGASLAKSLESLEGAPADVERLSAARASITHALAASRAAWEQSEQARRWLDALPERRFDLDRAIAEDNSVVEALNAQRLRLQQEERRMMEVAVALNDAAETRDLVKGRLVGATQRQSDARVAVAEVEAAKRDRVVMQTRKIAAEEAAEKWGVLARAWHRSGVPTLIMENGIPAIEARANEVLARLPGSFTIRLDTQRLNKTGGVRDELIPVIESAGWERDYEMLSGGEKFRVDFAIRLGISHVLSRQSGVSIRTLWLDEGWGSQDRSGREAMLESLSAMQDEFDLMVVVSHVPEVVDRFPTRLTVSKTGDTSTVELQQ